MIEHLILMSVVPPLVLLGFPVVPLFRGLPRAVRIYLAGPLLRMRALRCLAHQLVRPRFAWLLMNAAFLGWHIPAAYDFALEHELWHDVEHLCFLGTSLLFWACLIRPWPMARRARELEHSALFDRRRCGQYGTLRISRVLQPDGVFVLRGPRGGGGRAAATRPGARRGDHVGLSLDYFFIPAAVIAFALLQPAGSRRGVRAASARV